MRISDWSSDVCSSDLPVGAFEPYKEAYFAWIAAKGHKLPDNPEDVWRPADGQPGATRSAGQLPKELTDTAWFTERALTSTTGASNPNWLLHLGSSRPPPPFIAPAPPLPLSAPADLTPPAGPAPRRAARDPPPTHTP